MRIEKDLVNKLKLSYLMDSYEKILLEIDATKILLRYVFNSVKGVIKLTEKQKEDLNSDIRYLKQINKWDQYREKKILHEINENYEFYRKLSMLPEETQKIYFDKLMEETFSDL